MIVCSDDCVGIYPTCSWRAHVYSRY